MQNFNMLEYLPLLVLPEGTARVRGGEKDESHDLGAPPFFIGTGGFRELRFTFLVAADCFFDPVK